MKTKKIDEIKIDGAIYVPKSQVPQYEPKKGEQYCVLRSRDMGVFVGYADPELAVSNGWACVREAKRIHYWDKAASLSELAIKGTADPDSCRVPCAEPVKWLGGIGEAIPMTEEAIETIEQIPLWTCHE